MRVFLLSLCVLHSEVFGGDCQDIHVSLVITEQDTVFVDRRGQGHADHTLRGVLYRLDGKYVLKEEKNIIQNIIQLNFKFRLINVFVSFYFEVFHLL